MIVPEPDGSVALAVEESMGPEWLGSLGEDRVLIACKAGT